MILKLEAVIVTFADLVPFSPVLHTLSCVRGVPVCVFLGILIIRVDSRKHHHSQDTGLFHRHSGPPCYPFVATLTPSLTPDYH